MQCSCSFSEVYDGDFLLIWWRSVLEFLWMISLSLAPLLIIVYRIWRECCKGVKSPIWCLTRRNVILWYKKALCWVINFVMGIEVDKAKFDVIEKLPPSVNVKGVRSFLGHAGFYRRFIKDFSKIAKPLSNLLNKDVVFCI